MPLVSIPIAPSANIASVDYDEDARELWVQFHKGQYKYSGVSREVADGFSTSRQSAGQYFKQNVLNQFQYDRMA